ncbi:threonine-phosphate decarboxylase [Prevotella sp. 10(H)]|uniref:threonine-phosphate decarboxylase n=1 Tax=Prevotella sp. 10(H) TaxID=1158294 RepID=UPI0004A6C9F9|nr:threonine-phosphate decarboxylase [Prevotella sp. 10(H)]
MILGHGDDLYAVDGKKIISNFSSNVYGRQDMSALQDYLRLHIDAIHSYPEPDASSLVKLLAKKHNVENDNILVTNGATEAIYLIAQAFAGRKSAILSPTFSEYADACSINKYMVQLVSSLNEINDDTDLLWLCNPNNPTGKVTDKNTLKEYIEKHPQQNIIIDQSYEHFTKKDLFTVEEAIQYNNVILLHSMTKRYAIPGLRLGYISTHEDTLGSIKKYRMPWSVNGLAIDAGKYLIKENVNSIDIDNYLNETARLQNELKKISRITVYPTDTHFFLCKFEGRKASELKTYLIEEYGILIRDASNFYGLDESYFRIATQSVEENNTLIEALNRWI